MKGGAFTVFVSTAFQAQLAYRRQAWTSVFGYLVQVFARIAIWVSLVGTGASSGTTLNEMVTYTMVAAALLIAFDYSQLITVVGDAVKTGDIAVFLLKPVHYPLYLLGIECGNALFRIVAIVLPVVVATTLVHGLSAPASGVHAIMFVGFCVVAFMILFLLSVFCGLVSFWVLTTFALEWFLQGILMFCAGTVVPLWFFPQWLGNVLSIMPFAWISYYPAAVYLGKQTEFEAFILLLGGCGWALLLSAAVIVLWRFATRSVAIQGG